MSDTRVIGCKDELDGFYCIDCRFREDIHGCLQYREKYKLVQLKGESA